MSSDISLNKLSFFKHLEKIYDYWASAEDGLANVDAIVVNVGKEEDVAYRKSTSVQVYLFGYELSETIIVLCKGSIAFLTSKKKIEFLKAMEGHKENVGENVPTDIHLMPREKGDKDENNFSKLIDLIKASGQGKTVGEFVKDKTDSEFIDAWKAASKNIFEKVDINLPFSIILSTKDEEEMAMVKKACEVTCAVFQKHLRDQIIDIVDGEKKIKHFKLSEGCEQAIANKKLIGPIDPSLLEMCYPAIIQSGGTYNLKFSVASDKNQLQYDAVVCCIGVRYKSYCSNLVRTVLVDPGEPVQQVYACLLEAEEAILAALKPGNKFCDAYEAGVAVVRSKFPDLEEKLTKSMGSVTGIEFREAALLISPKTTAQILDGMVISVSIGVNGVVNTAAKEGAAKSLAIFLGDTAVVQEAGAVSLTDAAKKRVKSACLFFKAEEEGNEEGNKDDVLDALVTGGRGMRSTVVIQDKMRNKMSAEDKRREHQKTLAEALNAEAKKRIESAKNKETDSKVRKSNIAYKNHTSMPNEPEIKQLKIFVDKKNETIILPVYGHAVPFHVSSIKNVSSSVEGDHTYLRINFFHPGQSFGGAKETFPRVDATFIKELTYRSSNLKEPGELSVASSNLNMAFRLIKEVQKKFKTRETEEREKEGVVKQDKLVLSQNKANPRLKDLFVRPNLVLRRINGSLEAHVNGFRYTSIRGDKIDLLYNNIKHAFFQPCDHEMIILLHFHMKNAILHGKKKHSDIQFFTEVGEITTDLGKHQHMHDRDDLYAEHAEREMRHKLNSAFKGFIEKVNRLTNHEVDFDTPFRDLSFTGVPHRSSVLLQPTSGCLVHLTEWPTFVVTLEELELVHFERVSMTLKNFDMVFSFKDYTRKPVMVTLVPMQQLEHVKEWLNSCDIRYTEGIQSLNWPKIMKTILDDPEGFFETGGWNFLNTNDSDEEVDDEEDSDDDAYRPSEEEEAGEGGSAGSGEGSADGSGSSDSDEDYESEASASLSEQTLDSDDESGKSWSELEEEAKRDDRDKEVYGDAGPPPSRPDHPSSGGRRPEKRPHGASSGGHDRDRKRKSSGSGGSPDKHRSKHSSGSGGGGGGHHSSSKHGGGGSSSSSKHRSPDKKSSSSSKHHGSSGSHHSPEKKRRK